MFWRNSITLAALLPSIALAAQDFEADCAAVASKLNVTETTVWFSEVVPAGQNISVPEYVTYGCASPNTVYSVQQDICRVALRVATTEKSELSMEAWLPRNWSGRFLSTGNGGLGGCIQYVDVAYAASLGFAAVGTNNGHNGTSGKPFYENEEVVKDFAYRAMHTGVVVGKQLTSAFYSKQYTKSYYLGCSTGGRQGFKAVQDYPEDFDGVVAGSPALDFTNLINWSGSFYSKTGPSNSSSFLTADKRYIVNQAVLDQCDGLDGSIDGLIEDPTLCTPRPEAAICSPGSNSSNCLTSAQVLSAREILSPLYGENGTLLYPRLEPGADAFAPGGTPLLIGGSPFPYSTDWFRYVVYNNPSFDPTKLNTADYAANNAKVPYISTWNGDLSNFEKRGGKVLTYHGMIDSIISFENSARYYNHVSRTMSLPSSSLDDFYRYFRISGMAHCTGGTGAWEIGNQAASNATLNADGNVLMAMVKWIEEGVAPETITGTKFVNNSEALGIDYQRRHCRYPFRNVFQGGDTKSPDSWKCV